METDFLGFMKKVVGYHWFCDNFENFEVFSNITINVYAEINMFQLWWARDKCSIFIKENVL